MSLKSNLARVRRRDKKLYYTASHLHHFFRRIKNTSRSKAYNVYVVVCSQDPVCIL